MGLELPLLMKLGTAASAVGGLSESRYQAQVAKNNAQIAEANAQRSIEEGRLRAQQQDEAGAQERGRIIAEAGASGLTGGSIDLRLSALDRLLGRDRRAIEYGAQTESVNFQNRARDFRGQARSATTSGLFDFGTTLLDGAAGLERLKRFGAHA